MENNKKTERDALEKVFQTKLKDHTLPVDKLAWDGIRAKLKQHIPRQGWPTYFRLPMYAAASLAVLLTLGWLYLKMPEMADDTLAFEQSIVYEPDQQEILPITQLEPDSEIQQKVPPVLASTVSINASSDGNQGVNSTDSAPLESVVEELVEKAADVKQVEKELPTEETEQAVINDKEKKSGTGRITYEQLRTINADWTDYQQRRKRKKPLLAAGMGSGVAGANPTLSTMEFDRLYESLVPMASSSPYATALVPADFRDKEYAMPVSVGVKLRWQLEGAWSMESGMQYTYLQTTMSDAAWVGYSAVLQLHYLGLPLGVSVSLLNSPKWELYWTGGMMVEKGLRSVYDEYRNWGNSVFNTHVSKVIDGWQWSMYTSFGVGYRVDPKVVLYLDPQLNYYFENEQPLSIRTEMPLMMGISAGIRFEL